MSLLWRWCLITITSRGRGLACRDYSFLTTEYADYGDSEYARAFLPKVEITAWVDDARAEEVIRKMVEAARTGRMGDGKIFVLSAQSYEAVLGAGASK